MIGEGREKLLETSEYHSRPGGAPANLAVAASRLGADVKMTATVGNDHFGKLLIQKLEEENVDTSDVKKIEENTTLAFVSLKENAEPEFSFQRGADSKISVQQIKDSQDLIHIGSLPLTNNESAENIIQTVEKTDAKVSFDPNLRDELVDNDYFETLNKVIENTDILFAANQEIKELGDRDQLLQKVDEIVVSKGGKGAEVITENGTYSAEPPEVQVVDTTGAGDTLAGAYLAFRDEGVERALEKAVHAASLSIRKKGAMAAIPKRQELKNSLKSD